MRSVLRGFLLFGSLLSLTSCFNRLDTSAIEREIEAEIESQSRRISISEVRCPRNVYRQSGAYFRCVGYLRPEGEFTINVTQRDSQGNLDWDVPNSQVMLNMGKIEAKLQEEFAKQFSRRALIDCGALYRINQPGEQFECQVVGGVDLGSEDVAALIVRVDPEGNLNWYEVRTPAAVTVSSPSPANGSTGTTAPSPAETPTGVGTPPAAANSPTDEASPGASSEKKAGTRQNDSD
jgi:hypothetical protein